MENAEKMLERCWFGLANCDGESTNFVYGYIFSFGIVFAWIVHEIYKQWTRKPINVGKGLFWFQMDRMSVVKIDQSADAVAAGNQRTISAQTSVSLKEKHFSMCIHSDAPEAEEQLNDDNEWETLSDTTIMPNHTSGKTYKYDCFDEKVKSSKSKSKDDPDSRIPIIVREATRTKLKIPKMTKRRTIY
ncbi:uncharacterized protein Dwil_GK17114 [Drosophila willistoni]|uniref:Uncharacterized protein n=2 Tax=Drosophila willistoni TaxID=7260 RepID=B4NQ31_DROWI|nr:uncharacterized protein Dwil_GK17114 [Drosophila willistoni]